MCHHYLRLPLRGGRCYYSCWMMDCEVLHPPPSSIHPLCSGCPLQPSKPYSLPSALHSVLWNGKHYPPGPGHYASSIWFLHASDCAVHLCHAHSHSYSDADDIGLNPGTYGVVHSRPWNANGDRHVTGSGRSPQAKADCESALWGGPSSAPGLMELKFHHGDES